MPINNTKYSIIVWISVVRLVNFTCSTQPIHPSMLFDMLSESWKWCRQIIKVYFFGMNDKKSIRRIGIGFQGEFYFSLPIWYIHETCIAHCVSFIYRCYRVYPVMWCNGIKFILFKELLVHIIFSTIHSLALQRFDRWKF